jgi:hypothetical protein
MAGVAVLAPEITLPRGPRRRAEPSVNFSAVLVRFFALRWTLNILSM